MKNKLLLGFIIFFFSCSGDNEQKVSNDSVDNSTLRRIRDKSIPDKQGEQFLALFSVLDSDTIKVFSQYNHERTHFKGKPIKKEFYKYFIDAYDKESKDFLIKAENETLFDVDSDFHAILKFPISQEVEGLIIRTPGEYESTSIKLFLWDKMKMKAISYLEIAEKWGDAGDFYEASSKLKQNPRTEVIKHTYTSWQDLDNSENQETFDSLFYYRVKNNKIIFLKKNKTDSIELAKLGFR